jgi:hypothetical protein
LPITQRAPSTSTRRLDALRPYEAITVHGCARA